MEKVPLKGNYVAWGAFFVYTVLDDLAFIISFLNGQIEQFPCKTGVNTECREVRAYVKLEEPCPRTAFAVRPDIV